MTVTEVTKETKNSSFYTTDSTAYDEQRWTSRGGERTNRLQQQLVADLCADWRDERIVEVGPGTARHTIPLTKQGNRMTLVDIAPGMLEVARKNIEEAGQGEHIEDYVEGSIYELPFEDGAFDHAISLNVFNHLEQAGDALKELARVTRPGSTMLFNYANLQSYFYPVGRKINKTSTAVGQDVYSKWERPAEMRAHIEAAGLDLIRSAGFVHVPRAAEKYKLTPLLALLDSVSRGAPLKRFAPVHYCLCRRRG